MKKFTLIVLLFTVGISQAQLPVDLSGLQKSSGTVVTTRNNVLDIQWPAGGTEKAKMQLSLDQQQPLFQSIQLSSQGAWREIAAGLDPAFILTIGKRDLVSQNGWNIFFDRVPTKPYESYPVVFEKRDARIISHEGRTQIIIGQVKASTFTGNIEITLYKGSPLFNVAAVMSTPVDSTAILYDGGLVSKKQLWNKVNWSDVDNNLRTIVPVATAPAKNQEVKYRTIIGTGKQGNLALFPAPHQYFYPLDEAFNLKFTWHGSGYRNMIEGFGIGIRQDLQGDRRFVPWFNAPPGTQQRLNFFCLLSTKDAGYALTAVKRFTHNDQYPEMAGYKTMSSHFHIEHVQDVLGNKPIPETPNFVKVFKQTGVDIVHLGEFHGPGHPKGPAADRLHELHTLFEECERLSDTSFLLLPGEEPNNFLGGHWMNFFPRPVYWIMSRKPEEPFEQQDPTYGKVYRIADKEEMLKLLQQENGLAWTAHARTKGSTGYPDKYKDETFFKSDRFFGAAWKAMPADLSQPFLGNRRILDLMDDMANWGHRKHVIAEADLFKIEPHFEVYAHLNVNYLQLDKIPTFKDGWQPVLDAMQQGKYFVTTGEILLPAFTVNGKRAGETATLRQGKDEVSIEVNWTFPLRYLDIVSGDGNKTYREHIDLSNTEAFGKKKFSFPLSLANRKWVRVEVWDEAANGAFTQMVWLE
ncbi:hypothetical protein [Paraflavitalea sp. CAU 1676]|uniref:hypothetical protein n=1 Tax=Paraflavitalea sp. CAU 1676 TaxID=3032598 RepID=UPI0023DA65CA|nr:hypothetical protein [Paraflavitalea sp. CAU 1676]MDF2192945.1 hypothetical protein [Paraflavitalea sp. CAU 1676]